MRWLKVFYKKICQIEDGLLVFIFFLLTGLSLFQIVARNVFDGGVFWIEGASRVLVLWLALLGASVAGREGRHIRVDLLEKYLASRFVPYIVFLTGLACSGISGLLAWHSLFFIWQEMDYGDIAFASVPLWLCESIIPFVFSVLALRFFAQAFHEVWMPIRNKVK